MHVSKVHCGSAFEQGASGLPYYCTLPVCVPSVIGALAVWRQNIKKNKIGPLWAETVGRAPPRGGVGRSYTTLSVRVRANIIRCPQNKMCENCSHGNKNKNKDH